MERSQIEVTLSFTQLSIWLLSGYYSALLQEDNVKAKNVPSFATADFSSGASIVLSLTSSTERYFDLMRIRSENATLLQTLLNKNN